MCMEQATGSAAISARENQAAWRLSRCANGWQARQCAGKSAAAAVSQTGARLFVSCGWLKITNEGRGANPAGILGPMSPLTDRAGFLGHPPFFRMSGSLGFGAQRMQSRSFGAGISAQAVPKRSREFSRDQVSLVLFFRFFG